MTEFHAATREVASTRALPLVYDMPAARDTPAAPPAGHVRHVRKSEIIGIYATVVVVLVVTCLLSPLVGVICAAVVPAAHDAWLFLA